MSCEGNMPSFKYVTVANLVITYNDTPYPIKTFVTNKKYVIWNIDRPYQLEDSNVRPQSSLLEYLIVINDNGKPTIVEYDELMYSFDQTTNGSNLLSSSEYNALKTEVKGNTKKFNLMSNTVDGMSQIIGATEDLKDGTIIYNLNKVKSDSNSYGISIGEIQTKIDDKYKEIKPIILIDLVEYLRSISEYKLSFTNLLEDTLITAEEWGLINNNKSNITNKLAKLQSTLSDLKNIVDSIEDTEKSNLVTEMKNKLSTLHNVLVSLCDSYLQDSKISGEEKTNIIQKTYELTTYIDTVQNTCSNITVNGQAGVVYSIENELLMLKDKTTSSITELDRSNGTLTQKYSTLEQTVDHFETRFSEGGGSNLLRNSAFKNGQSNWTSIRWDNNAGGSEYIEVFYPEYNEWTPSNRNSLGAYVTGLQSSSNGMYLRCGFDSHPFKVKPNTTYTLNCLMAAHRVWSYTIEMICFDANGNRILDDNHTVVIYDVKTGGRDRNNWNKIKHTFTTQGNASTCILRAYMNEWNGQVNDAVMWICEPLVIEGNTDALWMPSADEVYTGITTIDKDGIIVKNGGLKIQNNSGENVLYGDNDGNLTLKGNIQTTSGSIGGFTIRNGAIYGNNVGLGVQGYEWAFWAGGNTSNSAPFRVGHKGEVVATDITINDGGLKIQNNNGVNVLYGDSNGNLVLSGGITSYSTITGGALMSTNGDMYFDMNGGTMALYDGGTKIGVTNKVTLSGTLTPGLAHCAEDGYFSGLGAKVDGSSAYKLMVVAASRQIGSMQKGLNLGYELYTNNWDINLNASYLRWNRNNLAYDSIISETDDNFIGIFGNDGTYLGYRTGSSNVYMIALRESGNSFIPNSLDVFNNDTMSNNSPVMDIAAPINMMGQSINQCLNIETLGINIIEPIAFSSTEVATRSYSVTKNIQDIVEFIGTAQIVNGISTVSLPKDVSFKFYMVVLSPIGENKQVSLIEKGEDYFVIAGDDCTVDYVIKFEGMSYSKYMSTSFMNMDNYIEFSDDNKYKPKELTGLCSEE